MNWFTSQPHRTVRGIFSLQRPQNKINELVVFRDAYQENRGKRRVCRVWLGKNKNKNMALAWGYVILLLKRLMKGSSENPSTISRTFIFLLWVSISAFMKMSKYINILKTYTSLRNWDKFAVDVDIRFQKTPWNTCGKHLYYELNSA